MAETGCDESNQTSTTTVAQAGWRTARLRRRVRWLLLLVLAIATVETSGCVLTFSVRVNNFLPVRVHVLRVNAPGDNVYDERRDLGWVEPWGQTILRASIGKNREAYRIRVLSPNGKLLEEFNLTHDSLDSTLRDDTWVLDVREPPGAKGGAWAQATDKRLTTGCLEPLRRVPGIQAGSYRRMLICDSHIRSTGGSSYAE